MKRIICLLLCACLCLAACIWAAASGVETDEDGGVWDYGRGIYTDPTGQEYEITSDDDSGSGSSSSSGSGEDGAIVIDTGETDPMAGAKRNEDGSIEIESGTGGVDIEDSPTRAPLEGEDWEAALAGVAAQNGSYTPTFWIDPDTGAATEVEVIYVGVGRSMVVLNGTKQLVNTADLKWQTEAPEGKVLAVVRSRQIWMRKHASNDIKNLKFKQIYRDAVVRVIAITRTGWAFVDHEGDRGYVKADTLEFFANDHTDIEAGYLSLNGKTSGKGIVQVRDPQTLKILGQYKPGTPVTVFDILDDFGYAEIDIEGWHCVVMLECLTLERDLVTAAE